MIRVCCEKCAGRGEDAFAFGEGFAVVCDGLGGSGSQVRRHADGRAWTEAKIAATAAARALGACIPALHAQWAQWLDDAQMHERPDAARRIAAACRAQILRALREEAGKWNAVLLPTTVAAWIAFPDASGGPMALALWAGDSRCYTMDDGAMRLHSRDDVHEAQWLDPMEELLAAGSPPMNNIACLSEDFVLHARLVPITRRTLLVACSDGAYGYLHSPMHLEYVLRLCHEYETCEEAQEDLHAFFAAVSGDDTTLLGLYMDAQGGGLSGMREMLAAGLPALQETYITPFPERPAPAAYHDLDQHLTEAAAALCEGDAFDRALGAYVLRQARSNEPAAPGMPCAGLIGRLRSMDKEERSANGKQDVRTAARAWYASFVGRRRQNGKADRELVRIAGRMLNFSKRAAVAGRTHSPRARRQLQQDGKELQKDMIKWIAILREAYGVDLPLPGESAAEERARFEARCRDMTQAYLAHSRMQDARWFLRRWLDTGCMPGGIGLPAQVETDMRHRVEGLARLREMNRQSDARHIAYKEEIRALWRRYRGVLMEGTEA